MPELNPLPRHWPGGGRVIIAFSGGPDSLCLLHSILAADCSREVVCLHVDHGLDSESSDRAQQAQALAKEAGTPCSIVQVSVDEAGSPEAAARKARYLAVENFMKPGDVVVTAHHADDQIETVMMRLFRGAGPTGLAGIPRQRTFGRGWLVRPLLDWSRADILRQLEQYKLSGVEDPANSSLAFDRNYLRQKVLPSVMSRWPGADRAILRTARLCAGAARTLTDIAGDDLEEHRAGDFRVNLKGTEEWTAFRLGEMLRHWCYRQGLDTPPGRRIETFIEQVVSSDDDRQPELDWPQATIRKWRNHLWMDTKPQPVMNWEVVWCSGRVVELPQGIGRMELHGALTPPELMLIRSGRPGESLQPAGDRHHRSVRQLMADRGIPPWQRHYWPRLWVKGELVGVGDAWRTRELENALGQIGATLSWHTTLFRGC